MRKSTEEPEPDTEIRKPQDEEKDKPQVVIEVEEPPKDATEYELNREAIRVTWTPLIDKKEKAHAWEHGYSFGSKKVAMGPGFINLRFMCHCLARAIKRHIDFS